MATLTTLASPPNFDRVQASYASYRNVRALLGAHDAITPQVLSLQLVEIMRLIVRQSSNYINNPPQLTGIRTRHLFTDTVGSGYPSFVQTRRCVRPDPGRAQ